jgi:hypothetical protein
MPLIWGLLINPTNKRVTHLTANELPDDWQTTLRDRWEYLHAIRAVLAFASLCALILDCLLTAPVAQAR